MEKYNSDICYQLLTNMFESEACDLTLIYYLLKYNRKYFIYHLCNIIKNDIFNIPVLGEITIYVAQRDLLLSVLICAILICKPKLLEQDFKNYLDHWLYIVDRNPKICNDIGKCIREFKMGELILLVDSMWSLNMLNCGSPLNEQGRLNQLDQFLEY